MNTNGTAPGSTPEPYVYRLKAVAKVVDGDTVDLDLDLGFSITMRQRVRLYGIDAPEVRSKDPIEKAKGLESQAFVAQWFERPGAVLVGQEADGSPNCFTARVASITFLGDIVRLLLQPADSPQAAIEAEVLRSRLDRIPQPGETIDFAMPPRQLMFLGDA